MLRYLLEDVCVVSGGDEMGDVFSVFCVCSGENDSAMRGAHPQFFAYGAQYCMIV